MQNTETVWDLDEIEIIVMEYLDMLMIELSGGQINKAERNRNLQVQISRSKGSIEYKHQNISAVMDMFGLPFIWGYKPAKNFQKQLYEVIESQLTHNNLIAQLAGSIGEPVIPSVGLTFEQAPIKIAMPDTTDPDIHRILRKLDPAARDARAHALGEAGEEFLFCFEKKRLSEAGKITLAKNVRWVSKEEGDGAGYDILSFSEAGEERWLEVKTTNGSSTTPFWISKNELLVSEKRRDVFRLVRLYDFSRRPAAYKLKPPLADHVHLTEAQFYATLL